MAHVLASPTATAPGAFSMRGMCRAMGLPLFYVAIGAVFVTLARDYPFGTAARMGPGFFPTIAGSALIVLGAVTGLLRVRAAAEIAAERIPTARVIRALACILGGFLAFATVERLGLVVAVLALVWIAALAQPGRRPVEMLVLGASLAAIAVAIFVEGLNLPLAILPR